MARLLASLEATPSASSLGGESSDEEDRQEAAEKRVASEARGERLCSAEDLTAGICSCPSTDESERKSPSTTDGRAVAGLREGGRAFGTAFCLRLDLEVGDGLLRSSSSEEQDLERTVEPALCLRDLLRSAAIFLLPDLLVPSPPEDASCLSLEILLSAVTLCCLSTSSSAEEEAEEREEELHETPTVAVGAAERSSASPTAWSIADRRGRGRFPPPPREGVLPPTPTAGLPTSPSTKESALLEYAGLAAAE